MSTDHMRPLISPGNQTAKCERKKHVYMQVVVDVLLMLHDIQDRMVSDIKIAVSHKIVPQQLMCMHPAA